MIVIPATALRNSLSIAEIAAWLTSLVQRRLNSFRASPTPQSGRTRDSATAGMLPRGSDPVDGLVADRRRGRQFDDLSVVVRLRRCRARPRRGGRQSGRNHLPAAHPRPALPVPVSRCGRPQARRRRLRPVVKRESPPGPCLHTPLRAQQWPRRGVHSLSTRQPVPPARRLGRLVYGAPLGNESILLGPAA